MAKQSKIGLSGINTRAGEMRELEALGYDVSYMKDAGRPFSTVMREALVNNPSQENVGKVGVNDSSYDKAITSEEQLDDLNNFRGEEQSWGTQLMNGALKAGVLTGTTFLNGTLGLLYGAGTAIARGLDGQSLDNSFAGLWDNDISKGLQAINEASEEALPNYYTNAELNDPWYSHIISGNFIGDKFIKNLGFSAGALYSGGLVSAGISSLTKLPVIMGAISASSKAPAIINSAIGAVASAANEASFEALQNSGDWEKLQKAKLDDKFNSDNLEIDNFYQDKFNKLQEKYKNKPQVLSGNAESGFTNSTNNSYQKELQQLKQEYNNSKLGLKNNYDSTIDKIAEDKNKMGNMDFLMNMPILTASNILQFGREYANGFKTARKASNIINKAGEYASNSSRLGNVAAITKGALSESAEELSQSTASNISGDYYSTDVSNFYKAKKDPKTELETLSWLKATAQGINETVNDGSAWEGAAIGFFTGLLGTPSFRKMRNSDGQLQSPITIAGGAFNEFREYQEKQNREQEIANYLNDRVNSPQFKNYYQGLIRHNKYQNDMDNAAVNNDEFNYKNAEHGQLVSDISMFDNAGKIEDLNTLINTAYDTSDENLESIVKNTTTSMEDGSKVGPFIDKNGNPMYATEEGKKEMIDKLTKTKEDMSNTINSYLKIKDDIDIKTGQRLSDNQLEELTWIRSQINNWNTRSANLVEEVKPALSQVVSSLSNIRNFFDELSVQEGSTNTNVTPLYEAYVKQKKSATKALEGLDFLMKIPKEQLPAVLASNENLVSGLKQAISENENIAADDAITYENKIDDIVKLHNATTTYNSKLKEYLTNPSKQVEEQIKADNKVAKDDTDNKVNDLKSKLSNSKTLSEFRSSLDAEDNEDIKTRTLNSLESEGSPMVKNHKETRIYDSEVRKNLSDLNADDETTNDALSLYQSQYDNSDNLDQLSNPNSIYTTNNHAFDEDSEGDINLSENRFNKAQYLLQTAMAKANNDNKYKDRFSPEYKVTPVMKNPTGNVVTKATTGDSGTPTIPAVSVNSPVNNNNSYGNNKPLGDISSDELKKDNASLNNTPSQNDDKSNGRTYYRPAIPQLHLEGIKQGDFRPFNVVAKERNPNVNFDRIYSYLENNNAFEYINNGNIKVGDEIGFMVDPEFSDTTIFLIDKKNNQIIGSLDESEYSVNKFIGLSSLSKQILSEYNNREVKDNKFYSDKVTKLSKIMVGKIPYGDSERNISEIPNVKQDGKNIVFGIIKNGTLSTNNQIDDSIIVKPQDMANKEGRMYLLIPNATGGYSPAAVRIKHFNTDEFDLSDITIGNTPLGREIKNAISSFTNAVTDDLLSKAISGLSQVLYTGDLHINLIHGIDNTFIRFTKVERDSDGREKYNETTDGKRIRVEKSFEVVISNDPKVDPGFEASFGAESITNTIDPVEAVNNIIKGLYSFNLPIQINLGMMNKGGYNTMIYNSNVLTSNIADARVLNSWFTTDYYDNDGNLQKSVNPENVSTSPTPASISPVGGSKSSVQGTKVFATNSKKTYYVDLEKSTISDSNGALVPLNDGNRILLDLAWANEQFGDSSIGSLMIDNKVITPDGKVLDRTTQKYITGEEANKVKNQIKDSTIPKSTPKPSVSVNNSDIIISNIYDNQKKVDKERTDSENYYILEDDGEYHPYSRVHSRLGNNWNESENQSKLIDSIKNKLLENSNSIENLSKYLSSLEVTYGVDLTEYKNTIDAKSRGTILNLVRDKIVGTNSSRALSAGTAIDNIVRQFFINPDVSKIVRPSNLNQEAFISLITKLTEIKKNIEDSGERFLTDNIVVFNKYPDGTRIAGEVDIISVDKNGNFKIYDLKTGKYSFHDFINKYGKTVNYFVNKSPNQNMSTKDYYTLQLSGYKNLFENQYNTPITKLAILPFVLGYEGNTVTSIIGEKGISITYNPAVNIPLMSSASTKVDTPPVNDSTNSIKNPINNILPEYRLSLDNVKEGYFVIDNEIHNGYIAPITIIGGTTVYITKVPVITKGLSGKGNGRVVMNNYYAVFPNGQTVLVLPKALMTVSDKDAVDRISKALSANPKRVADEAAKDTILSDEQKLPNRAVEQRNAATILAGSKVSGASKTIQSEQGINNKKNSRTRHRLSISNVDNLRSGLSNDISAVLEAKSKETALSPQDAVDNNEQLNLWDSLSSELIKVLESKQWTKENFNAISEEERRQVLKCLHL